MSGLHQDTAGFGVSDHQHGLSEQETREMLMDQAMVDHDDVPEHELVNELGRDDDDEGAMALATAAVDAATAASANEQLQQAGGGSEAHVEQGDLGDAEQATSDEPARKRSISQVEQSEQDGGDKPGEDGETLGDGTSAAEGASEGGVAATTGARKRGRPAGGQSAASNSGHGKQQADESDAGATSSAGPTAGPGGPGEGGRELSEQERRARQREANRKAAERSRGKKNEELNNLERTVSKIQEENAKLRAQLEMLLDAAGAPAAQTATGGATETSSSTPGPSTDVMAVDSNQDAHPTLSSAATAGVTSNSDEQRPDLSAPPPLALGADGLDLEVLGSLAAEVRSLKAQLAAKRAQMAADAASGAPSTADVDNADVATERAALSALIDHLRESRDAADMERQVLEREIAERRAISKALSTRAQAQAQTPEQQGEEGAAEAESNKDVLREIEEEIRRNRQGAGVERALVEVRSWIDEAIKDWKKVSRASRAGRPISGY